MPLYLPTAPQHGVCVEDYGAVPNSNVAGIPAANAAAFLRAFAASPYVYGKLNNVYYTESIVIPVTAKHLKDCTFFAGGTYSASTALISVTNNANAFTLDNCVISVSVATYTTTNGVMLSNTTDAVIRNSSLSGIYPVYIVKAKNSRVLDNVLASTTFGRGIFALCDGAGASTFTVTSASPAVFTKATHGLAVNDTVILYTTGALYTGLTVGRVYYVKTVPTANTFTLALTAGGTAINTSGAQSGTHYYTSNGPVGLVISGNTIYKSTSVNSQGIVLTGVADAVVSKNTILGGGHFGISSSLGTRVNIEGNNVSYTEAEGVHTDSGVNTSITDNVLVFDSTSADVGISVSSDNGPPAVDTNVDDNTIDSPFGAGIYFVGATGCSAQGNKIKNANIGDTTLSASIILDGSNTTKCLIGPNTIEDSVGNNDYQVGEANYTSGAPSANFIAPQIGAVGLLGRILNVATTDTAVRASNSPSSIDTRNGFWFNTSPFAKRDTGGLSNYIYDYSSEIVISTGDIGSSSTNYGNTSHVWYGRGFGSIYASLGTGGWGWTNVAMGGTPSAGTSRVLVDSTTKALVNKDDAGVIHTTVIPNTGTSRQFVSAVSAAGVITTAAKSNTSLVLQASRGTNQTPAASTWVKVQLTTETADPNGWFDNVTNFRFQPNVAGVFLVTGGLAVAVGAGSYGGVAIYKNGTEWNKYILSAGVNDQWQLTVPALVELNGSSDYIELFGYSTAAAPLFVGTGTEVTKLNIYQLY